LRPTIVSPPRRGLIPALAHCPIDDPIFALDAEARRRAANGEAVINATLGMLMEDDGSLAVLPAVQEAYARIDRIAASGYAPLAGTAAFREAVIEDVFGGTPLRDSSIAVATAGGTGAIHAALSAFLDHGQAVYTTSYYWGPYEILAQHAGRKLETFSMFDARGRFDLAAFESGLAELLRKQDRALILLNFPCHNPTGYSLDESEWDGLARVLREAGERAPVTLCIDLAYARFAGPGAPDWVQRLLPATESCTLLVAWSASKAFAQYGARIGALLAVAPDAEERTRIQGALTWVCRGTWSNCNHAGLLAITDLLTAPELARRVERERGRLKHLLGERVTSFNREATRVGLRTPRYEGGFFVLVFTADAKATAELARTRGVYVVPGKGALRVAISSTPARDMKRLAEALAEGSASGR
jgi:aromatic-amino-acid transaminase